uniref:Rab-GAP TBC domain-containing protein n=1 Tax=Phytophthora ramorum TaxID=164328 RepID=H3HCQ2_PHYRM
MKPRADWFTTSGARELRDSSALDYREYVHRSEDCQSPQFEEDLRQIELDLPRTGESIRLFLLSPEETEALQDEQEDEDLPQHVMERFLPALKNILAAYAVRNPRVGYVQGHADVLCFLLGNVNNKKDEEEAFWVYASVIERTVDLPLVTTLLSCKWFVSIWVGELPLPLLYEVWDTMLREDDVDKIQLHMEMEQWDSSYIYKIILSQCQTATEIDPQTLLQQARTLYGLKDESVEDMRAALRRLPQLRKAEFTVLSKQTHFSHLEMERLQDEFTFLRYQRKICGRSKLRGLRQEELESILSREFSTFLSAGSRGAPEEKARLLFQIPNLQDRKYLDKHGINKLAG